MKDISRQTFKDHLHLVKELLEDESFHAGINKMAADCLKALHNGNKILFCGNGGSAADAQHIAAELSGKFKLDRKALYAEALHVNSSYMTAVANDYGFEHAYSRLVQAKGQKGDILIGLSTSGHSQNVINAFTEAKKTGMLCIAWTGKGGGKLARQADLHLEVPSAETPRIQEIHVLAGHILCDMIEQNLFGE